LLLSPVLRPVFFRFFNAHFNAHFNAQTHFTPFSHNFQGKNYQVSGGMLSWCLKVVEKGHKRRLSHYWPITAVLGRIVAGNINKG